MSSPESLFPQCGLSLVLQRTPEAEIRRLARRLMLTLSFRDRRLSETVNVVSSRDLFGALGQVPFEVVRGEVLVDSRGRGSFQR